MSLFFSSGQKVPQAAANKNILGRERFITQWKHMVAVAFIPSWHRLKKSSNVTKPHRNVDKLVCYLFKTNLLRSVFPTEEILYILHVINNRFVFCAWIMETDMWQNCTESFKYRLDLMKSLFPELHMTENRFIITFRPGFKRRIWVLLLHRGETTINLMAEN